MEVLKELTEQGKQLGYEGDDLKKFVKEQQELQREERMSRRLKEEKEMALRELDLKVREREKMVEEQQAKLHLLEVEHKLKLEMLEANDKNSLDDSKGAVGVKSPKLPSFDEAHDEMDSYLRRFERYAIAHKWSRDIWATNLSALLKGRALDVYARLPTESALEYDDLKSALLKRFDLTEDGFKRKFRSSGPEEGETFQQYACRLAGYLDRWIAMTKTGKTFEKLHDLMLREQVLNMCSKELVLFLKEHVPKTVDELTTLADQFREARNVSIIALTVHDGKTVERFDKRFQHSGGGSSSKIGQSPRNGGSASSNSKDRSQVANNYNRGEKRCYRCGKLGHIASDKACSKPGNITNRSASCHGRGRQRSPPRQRVHFKDDGCGSRERSKSPTTHVCNAFTSVTDVVRYVTSGIRNNDVVSVSVAKPDMPTCKGLIDGKEVVVLRDTGCSGVIVRRNLVEKSCFTGKVQRCALADGSQVEVPVAEIDIDTPFYTGKVTAWCMANPLYDVILGNIPDVRNPDFPDTDWENRVQAVQTRQQVIREKTKEYRVLKVPAGIGDDVGPEELKRLQESDSTLEKVRRMVVSGDRFKNSRYVLKNGLIFREFVSPKVENGKVFMQIVVPEKLRDRVMKLAHDSVMSGHLGCKRSTQKVLAEFYWPGVLADIRRFCQSCDVCQRTVQKGKVVRAPLGKMPLIDVPFQRVAVDIVGPIEPRTEKGNRYILTLVDYATRYPEAVALPSIEAERVAEALLEMFCRLGVPSEMLTDLGSQFTSEVMKEVSRLLSLRQLTTTPYHPICNGLVERFNGTMKQMLKRLCLDRPKDWDRYLGPVLFAYRDAPQESLGFSPFELIYGRSVRGPMSILRELWTKEVADNEVKSTYQYIVDLSDRLEHSHEIAHSNLDKASKRYAKLYNRRARHKQLKVGQRVLVLLPTKSNKLLLQWKGPYTVLDKVGILDYKIQMGNKVKTFHANMLKSYIEREPDQNAAGMVSLVVVEEGLDEEGLDEPPLIKTTGVEDCKIDDQLSVEQMSQLNCLLKEFQDVLSSKPGYTNLWEHDIKLTTNEPVRSKQYPIPFALKQVVIDEVKSMLDLKVIEPSESEYCSNFVIVKKPDGTNRFCIDFRALNKVTVFDCEPMPNIEDIFVKLSRCKYLSKIDLTKGYWQLPLKPSVKHLTAFQTPLGLFQFRTMPFGLVCASASFTRLMRKMLAGLSDVDNFIDDIIIYTETFEGHLVALRGVFQRLRSACLTAKPTKCHFCFKSVECLGHVVGDNQMQPHPDKIKAIKNAKRPETKKQVRSFLGLVGFYRKFVPNFATIALPLTELTKKGLPNKIVWGDAQERAFCTLKSALCKRPVLKLAEIGEPFILQTDASDTGVGSVLLQVEDGVRKPVAYASRKLGKAELGYATIEKECLAIVWSIQKFHRYLYGCEFTLETDHMPLSYLSKAKLTNARLMRWALLLQPYRFSIVAIPGKSNIVADGLSRL